MPNWLSVIISLAPTVVTLVEKVFPPKGTTPAPALNKQALALQVAQTAVVAALGIAPGAFGAAEQALIKSVNDAMVAYYNSKGWPTTV